MSKNQVGSSTLRGASIDISTNVSVDMSVVPQLTLKTNTSVGYVPRVNTGLTSTNVGQYIDRDIVDSILAEAYWSNTGQLPVVYWSTVGLASVASRKIVDR